MKLVKNSDITLTVDGNGAPIFFEPVKSQQTVLCIEGHKYSDFRTFEALLTASSGLLSPQNTWLWLLTAPLR